MIFVYLNNQLFSDIEFQLLKRVGVVIISIPLLVSIIFFGGVLFLVNSYLLSIMS